MASPVLRTLVDVLTGAEGTPALEAVGGACGTTEAAAVLLRRRGFSFFSVGCDIARAV